MEDHGEIKDLTPKADAEALIKTVNRHQAEIVALRAASASVAEVAERVTRMQEDTASKLAKLKENERVEWVPGGSASDLDARFLMADGSVRFGPTSERVQIAGVAALEIPRPGLLTDDKPVTAEHKRVTDCYRAWTVARNMQTAGWAGMERLVEACGRHLLSSLAALPGRVGDFCRRSMFDSAQWQRVMSGTAGSGGELISNPTLGLVRRPMLLQRKIAGMVRTEPVENSTFKVPTVSGHFLLRKTGVPGNDPARFPVQSVTTADTSISVVDLAMNVLLHANWVRDAASVLGDPIAYINNLMDEGIADSTEIIYLHGDTAATHQDTLSTMTLGGYYTAGQLDGSDSPLKAMLGFRARAFDDSNTGSGGGAFTATTHYTALNAMGNHGAAAVMMMGLGTFYVSILGNSLFTSYNNMGPAGTLLPGNTLGAIGQTPIAISEFMPSVFDTSSGLITGSNAGKEILYADPTAWRYYELTQGANAYDVSYQEKGVRYLGMTQRGVLVPVCVSTEKPCYVLYNT